MGSGDGVRTAVGDDVGVDGGDRAVLPTGDLHLLPLVAGVPEPGHVLGAGRCPADRSTDLLREEAEEQLLRVHPGLGPEAPADVGRRDPDLFLVHPVPGGEHRSVGMHTLARRVVDQAVAVPPRSGDSGFDRARGQALIGDRRLDDDLVGDEWRVGAALVVVDRVRSVLGVEHGGIAERGVETHDGGERLVVDEDELGGVGRCSVALGNDGDDRFADEARDGVGQHRSFGRRREHRQVAGNWAHVGGCEVSGRHDRQHAGCLQRFTDVDVGDLGVRHHRRHEGDHGGTGQVEVGDEGGVAEQQVRVLDSEDGCGVVLGQWIPRIGVRLRQF